MIRLLLLSVIFVSPLVLAEKNLDKQAIQLSLAAGNTEQQRLHIEKTLTQVEYSELRTENRTALNEHFGLIENSSNALARTSAEAKINDILNLVFADSKLSCTFETVLGSNMKKRTCMTAAARKRSFEVTQRTLQGQKSDSVHVPQS